MAGRQVAIEGNSRAADRRALKLDNPLVVQWEYASEERLAKRNAAYRQLVEGPNAEEIVFAAVAEANPSRVLEVGCGTGELAERIQRELGATVVAVDLSPRMVSLAAERGIDARLADAQELPFADGEFDCVVAGWVLYHLPDVDRGISELVRVLEPGGTFVAGTLGADNFLELWELLGDPRTDTPTFGRENGKEWLERHFPEVEFRDAQGVAVFPDRDAMRTFVAVTITHAHLADRVRELDEPFRARTSHAVFVARKPR
ncbi:MAG: class I SAM-dependent methyltransferase [Gaiellaceae bacterium]